MDAEILARTLDLPPELAVFLIGTLPIFELRGAIPVAVGYYGMTPAKAYLLSVVGNLVPVVPLLLFLEPVSDWLRNRFGFFETFFTWLFERTHRKHSERYDKYGALALIPFVAIPLPVTGAWTGCAAAFVFGIKFRYSLPAITFGVLFAGVVVTAGSLGVVSILP